MVCCVACYLHCANMMTYPDGVMVAGAWYLVAGRFAAVAADHLAAGYLLPTTDFEVFKRRYPMSGGFLGFFP